MITAFFDRMNGQLTIGDMAINKTVLYSQFINTYQGGVNLIYGDGGDAKYCLKEKINLFSEVFWICFIFEDCKLQLVELILANDSSSTAQSYNEASAMKEFTELHQLLLKELGTKGEARRPHFQCWKYSWGEIDLVYQIQDISVFISILWSYGT
jgi:hypothetical protein